MCAVKRLPEWAVWSEAAATKPWTVGVEEELMLLRPSDLMPASCSEDVLAGLPPALRGRVLPETHACALEITSAPHATIAAAVADLAGLRTAVAAELAT